jgi:hypothetical protein
MDGWRDFSELPPRARVLVECAIELMDFPLGQGELVVQVEDQRVRRWRKVEGWFGADALSRFDANRLDPETPG